MPAKRTKAKGGRRAAAVPSLSDLVHVSGYTTKSGRVVRDYTRKKPAAAPHPHPTPQAGPPSLDAATAIHYAFAVGNSTIVQAIGELRVETTEQRTRMVPVPRRRKDGGIIRRKGQIQYEKNPTGKTRRKKQTYTITLFQLIPYDLDALARAVAAGRSPADERISDKLSNIRQASREYYEADQDSAAEAGRTYRRQFIIPSRSTGHLSDAWVNELRFWFDADGVEYEIVPHADLVGLLGDFDDRPSGQWWTNDNGNMFDALKYARELSEAGLGPDYVVFSYQPDYDAVYLVKVWIKRSERDRNRGKKKRKGKKA